MTENDHLSDSVYDPYGDYNEGKKSRYSSDASIFFKWLVALVLIVTAIVALRIVMKNKSSIVLRDIKVTNFRVLNNSDGFITIVGTVRNESKRDIRDVKITFNVLKYDSVTVHSDEVLITALIPSNGAKVFSERVFVNDTLSSLKVKITGLKAYVTN